MSVTSFFVVVALILASIFLFFKPLDIKVSEEKNLAEIELFDFELYRVYLDRVRTVFTASSAEKFGDTYYANEIDLLQYLDGDVEQIKSKDARYEDGLVTLENGVVYLKGSGFSFSCDKATYAELDTLIRVHGEFTINQGFDNMRGVDLLYNTQSGDISAKNIAGSYRVEEES